MDNKEAIVGSALFIGGTVLALKWPLLGAVVCLFGVWQWVSKYVTDWWKKTYVPSENTEDTEGQEVEK